MRRRVIRFSVAASAAPATAGTCWISLTRPSIKKAACSSAMTMDASARAASPELPATTSPQRTRSRASWAASACLRLTIRIRMRRRRPRRVRLRRRHRRQLRSPIRRNPDSNCDTHTEQCRTALLQLRAGPAVGENAGEPSIGYNPSSGRAMFIAGLQTLRVTFPQKFLPLGSLLKQRPRNGTTCLRSSPARDRSIRFCSRIKEPAARSSHN